MMIYIINKKMGKFTCCGLSCFNPKNEDIEVRLSQISHISKGLNLRNGGDLNAGLEYLSRNYSSVKKEQISLQTYSNVDGFNDIIE